MTFRYRTVALAASALAFPALAQQQASRRSIEVDAAATVGTIKYEHGFSGPPVARSERAAQHPMARGRAADITEAYRRARITLVRTHDADVGDIDSNRGTLKPVNPGFAAMANTARLDVIFPDMTADPENPASYDFAAADALVRDIHATGAQVVFRLGRGGAGTADIPRDLARYAAIVRHIVLHFNKGWGGGMTNAVRYFEVWNEPDLGHLWWRGTPEEFFALYQACAQAVKAADPQALVGGPAIAMVNEPQPYREDFLRFVKDNRLPLDFYSWHYYSDAHDPYDFVRIGKDIRAALDKAGFPQVPTMLNEWNDGVFGPQQDDTSHAAFIVSALSYMQDAPIDSELLYRADREFNADGTARTQVGSALQAFGQMADTRQRLAARGGDDKGLAVLAGRSVDGRQINVLVSNYEVPVEMRSPRSGPDEARVPGLFTMKLPPRRTLAYEPGGRTELSVRNLPRGKHFRLERYRLDPRQGWGLVERRDVTGTARIVQDQTVPFVELLVLRRR